MTTTFVPKTEFHHRLSEQEGITTLAPTTTAGTPWLTDEASETTLEALAQQRPAQSCKSVLMPATESMGRYGPNAPVTALEAAPVVLLGVRACELRAKTYLDAVMLGGAFTDPLYQQRTEAMTVIACDCVACADSCFCTLTGGKPYAEGGYDVNLTPLEDGYIAEAATDKGREWLEAFDGAEVSSEQLAQRDRIRREMVEKVTARNAEFGFTAEDGRPRPLPDDADEAWQQFAGDCVECGACTHICPTCHCFYLYDQVASDEQFERVRTWDSCLLSTYHRMAGGPGAKLTPRPRLSGRLANRVLHKFSYSPAQYGLLGCVGCGRCVDACLGDIDIRRVVGELGP